MSAQSSLEGAAEQPLPPEQRAQINYDAYILGPGDGLEIELLDLPELTVSSVDLGRLYLQPNRYNFIDTPARAQPWPARPRRPPPLPRPRRADRCRER